LGNGKYRFDIPTSAPAIDGTWQIIWNDGSVQTKDLVFANHGMYSGSNKDNISCNSKITDLCEGGSTGEDPNPNPNNPNPDPQPQTGTACLASADEQVVFFKAPSGFGTSASVYMWINGTNTHLVGSWPGSAATHLGDGVFKFELPANMQGEESQWMIIWNNNGQGLQTEDLKFTMRGLYTSDSDIKGTSCTNVVTTLCEELSTDIEQGAVLSPSVRKVLINGQLYIILEDGRIYDIMGGRP
jgi:hypothetical protein